MASSNPSFQNAGIV
jgi:hypothetical protein